MTLGTRTQPLFGHARRTAAPRCVAAFGLVLGAAALAGCAGERADPAATATYSPGAGSPWLRFDCASGEPVAARYAADGQTVQVRRGGREYRMALARSASGARYAGAGLEWWTKGSGPGATGTLLRHEADGGPGAPLDDCTQR